MKQARKHGILFRVTDAERDMVKGTAEAMGMSQSEMIRYLVQRKSKVLKQGKCGFNLCLSPAERRNLCSLAAKMKLDVGRCVKRLIRERILSLVARKYDLK